MSRLSDRLRGIVGAVPRVEPAIPATHDVAHAAVVLGGRLVERVEGALVVVDRFYPPERLHGREPIGAITETIGNANDALETLRRAWPSRRDVGGPIFAEPTADKVDPLRLLFLDLETTGLAGGAGTYAFLVGCAVLDDDGLRVRQFLLPGYEHERALLAEVASWIADDQTLVTFNGRSFDVPLIETRFLYHRQPFPLEDRPHIDMLHASRRLWKHRPSVAGPPLDEESCRLSVLERHLGGVHRVGDVPGFEIPSRFFQFVRGGNPFPLEAVLEHNRIDLISLALVTARALRLIDHGPASTSHPRECLGLGRLYDRAGRRDDAEACFAHAARAAARIGREMDVHGEALRWLAIAQRRAGRMNDAATTWQQLVELPGCPAIWRREAREALAIYHEHRSRQFDLARLFVLDAMTEPADSRWQARAEHRLRRLERKLEVRQLPLN